MPDYFLCAERTVRSIAVPDGEGGVSSASLDVCSRWVDSSAFVVANVLPSPAGAAELYGAGFALVIGPALIIWVGVAIVRAIRAVTTSH